MKIMPSSKSTGWSANALFILLFFFVIFVIMAAFMPAMQTMIGEGASLVGAEDGGQLLTIIFYSVPILLVCMGLYALVVVIANR